MQRFKHLQEKDRFVIQKMIWGGYSQSNISRTTGYHKSTINRELKQNNRNNDNFYRALIAQKQSDNRKKKKNKPKPESYFLLHCYVVEKLLMYWSPEEISERINIDYPANKKMRISHETIYLWLYKKKALGGIFYKYLRHLRPKRQKRSGKYTKRMIIKDKKSIHSRPKEVDGKTRFGDWESDTVVGKGQSGYIATHVERKTKYLIAVKMDDKKAETLNRATAEGFCDMPNSYIKTITSDNGTEFANFKNLEDLFECDFYFADPYSSWQRGLNENTNGLLRQFFPKKIDFKSFNQNTLDYAVGLLNHRPRKSLNYLTPYEALLKETSKECVAFHT